MTETSHEHRAALARIIESARRLGVELDESDALQWLAAMTSAQGEEIVIDRHSGVFGHRITLLDFSPEDLEHFRRIGRLVEFGDIPGQVETALALSGSAAQSKIQTYPGDADFFERVNIYADTRQEACSMLARLIREKALSTLRGSTYELMEVHFGSYPAEVMRAGKHQAAGSPIAWSAQEVVQGAIQAKTLDGQPLEILWEQVAENPGWCKLDWVVANPARRRLVNASNMLDATWEAPDGSITPLDGYLDSYFQEVYLEAESIPVFSKLVRHVSADSLDDYVSSLRKEVKKYISGNPNYGKAAKRLYNIFRLEGRYVEAAYIRELFDEPASLLYQVWSLIRTIDDSFGPDAAIDIDTIAGQANQLILDVIQTLEGDQEREIVETLLRLRDQLTEDAGRGELSPQAAAARAQVINLVNNFFYDKLTGVPEIKQYIDALA